MTVFSVPSTTTLDAFVPDAHRECDAHTETTASNEGTPWCPIVGVSHTRDRGRYERRCDLVFVGPDAQDAPRARV